jgi:uncharacterized protein YkuJ
MYVYHKYTQMNTKFILNKQNKKEKYDFNSWNFSAITRKTDKLG